MGMEAGRAIARSPDAIDAGSDISKRLRSRRIDADPDAILWEGTIGSDLLDSECTWIESAPDRSDLTTVMAPERRVQS